MRLGVSLSRYGLRMFRGPMFVQHEHAMRWEVVIAGKVVAGQEIVHGFVELDSEWRVLMIQQEEHLGVFLLAHADFDVVGDLEQWMEIAKLP